MYIWLLLFLSPKICILSLYIKRAKKEIQFCDKWGGAESHRSGARPVELMIMNDICTTRRSRVPRRSSGRIKGGVTREDQSWTLYSVLCAAVIHEGLTLYFCVWIFYYKKIKIKSRPSPLLSCTVVAPPSILPELLRGTRYRCRSSSLTPPASLRSHGFRPRPTRHKFVCVCVCAVLTY